MVPSPRLVLCLLLAGLCILQARGMFVPVDCCESTRDTALPPHRLPLFKGYEIQGTENGCSIKAFVLITVRNRKLCYPPDSSVAIRFKKALDDRKARRRGKTLPKRRVSSQD